MITYDKDIYFIYEDGCAGVFRKDYGWTLGRNKSDIDILVDEALKSVVPYGVYKGYLEGLFELFICSGSGMRIANDTPVNKLNGTYYIYFDS